MPVIIHNFIIYTNLQKLNTSFNISASAKKGKTLEAFEDAYTEAERLKRFGIAQAELDRTKKLFISSYDDFLSNKKAARKNSKPLLW